MTADLPIVASPATVVLSFTTCWALFFGVSRVQSLHPRKALNRKETLEWDNRLVSTLHAVVLVVGAAVCLLESRGYSRDQNVTGYTPAPDFFARILLGYLVYDVSCMLAFRKALWDGAAVVHHLIFIFLSAYVLLHSIMAFPFIWLSFGEISTPSVNLRWHLAVLTKKGGRLYLWNGVALALLFFCSRIVCYGLGLAHLWSLRDIWMQPKMPPLTSLTIGTMTLGYILNIYWMWAILKGVVRALQRPKAA